MKRLFDILFSLLMLFLFAPVMLIAMLLIWLQDRHSPIFRAQRVGINNQNFLMTKLRSMGINAERQGGTSTSATDIRITPVGHYIRKLKLDELSQFWDVLMGSMSIVGPRPNTRRGGVDHYTDTEMQLLSVRPGITDLSSIVFSDEGAILSEASDPDDRYNRIIRPWKSRLGLFYVRQRSFSLDLQIIWLTALALINRKVALRGVHHILLDYGVEPQLAETCLRRGPLQEIPPPGMASFESEIDMPELLPSEGKK